VIVDKVVIVSADAFTSKTLKWIIEWSLCWARSVSGTECVREASTCASTENFSSLTLCPTAGAFDFKWLWKSQFSGFCCSTINTKTMLEDSILLIFSNTFDSIDRIVDSWWETEDQGLSVGETSTSILVECKSGFTLILACSSCNWFRFFGFVWK